MINPETLNIALSHQGQTELATAVLNLLQATFLKQVSSTFNTKWEWDGCLRLACINFDEQASIGSEHSARWQHSSEMKFFVNSEKNSPGEILVYFCHFGVDGSHGWTFI